MISPGLKKTAACLIAVAAALCTAPAFSAENVPVRVIRLGSVQSREQRRYFGTVQGAQRVSLSFRVPGPLVELPAEMGMRMAKGDLVGRIDPRDFRTALAEAKSQLAQAQAKHTQAQKDYARYDELRKNGVVAQAEYDRYRTAYDVARSAVKTAEANVAAAQNALDDTELRAPFDGIIIARLVENYQDVQAKQPIAMLQDLTDVEIVISVPEEDVATIAVDGDVLDTGALAGLFELEVSVDSLPSSKYRATFKEISAQADSRTQTYSVTLTMPQPSEIRLLPGMSVRVTAYLPEKENAGTQYAVPLSALTGDLNGAVWLWKADEDGRIEKTPVTAGAFRGDSIEVSGSLSDGDLIITSGARSLRENDTVRIVGEYR